MSKLLQGTGVTINSLHPGAVSTDILRNSFWLKYATYPLRFLLRTAKSGAQTSLTVALDPDLAKVSGKYFDDCSIKNESKLAQDDDTAEWLWRESEKLAGLVK